MVSLPHLYLIFAYLVPLNPTSSANMLSVQSKIIAALKEQKPNFNEFDYSVEPATSTVGGCTAAPHIHGSKMEDARMGETSSCNDRITAMRVAYGLESPGPQPPKPHQDESYISSRCQAILHGKSTSKSTNTTTSTTSSSANTSSSSSTNCSETTLLDLPRDAILEVISSISCLADVASLLQVCHYTWALNRSPEVLGLWLWKHRWG